jgi:hypothetical protein
MKQPDPLGYYEILRVRPDATLAQIRRAYRKRAMELHPDRNSAPAATTDFQLLQIAYKTLRDPKSRTEYDAHQSTAYDPMWTLGPVPCFACGLESEACRHVTFFVVRSAITTVSQTVIAGVFCVSCARKEALFASAETWLLGFWSIPVGVWLSCRALLRNMLGGEMPPLENAKLLLHQAEAFTHLKQMKSAAAAAADGLNFAREVPVSISEREVLIENLQSFCGAHGRATHVPSGAWRRFSPWTCIHIAAFLLPLILLIFAVTGRDLNASRLDYQNSDLATPQPLQHVAQPKFFWVREMQAPNGQPWPKDADYLADYPIENSDGASTLEIDNSRVDSDVYAKVVLIRGRSIHTVRWFYIPAFGRFTVDHLAPGRYIVRYRNLSNGYDYDVGLFNVENSQSRVSTDSRHLGSSRSLSTNMILAPISDDAFASSDRATKN